MTNHRRLSDALLLPFVPARWSIAGFRFVPLVLLVAGVWAVIYGGYYHRIAVSEIHTQQISKPVPVDPTMPPAMPSFSATDAFGQPSEEPHPPGEGFGPPPGAFGPPDAFGPPVKFIQVVETTKTTSEEGEVVVNRAVTVEGIVRDPQGEIVRVAADGPGFCPS